MSSRPVNSHGHLVAEALSNYSDAFGTMIDEINHPDLLAPTSATSTSARIAGRRSSPWK